jgi:putative inorganic carbon (hco3(-)) transporter
MATFPKHNSEKTLTERIKPFLDIFIVLAIGAGAVSGILVVEVQQHAYVLLGLVGLLTFAVTIFSVEFGLVMLVFLAYTRFSDIAIQYHGAPSVAKFFVVLLIGAIFMRWSIFREEPQGWFKPTLLIATYGLIGFGSLIYAPEASRVIDQLSVYAKDAIITIVVVVLLTRNLAFKRAIWSLILIGIFLGSLSVWQYVTNTYTNNYWGFAQANIQHIIGESNDYRIAGPIGDANYYAQIMGVIVLLALERILHEKNRWLRLLASWSFIVSLLAVVLTYSRGGFLALSIGVVVLLYYYRPRVYHMPLIILAFIGFFMIAPPQYLDRVFSLQEFFQTSGNLRTDDLALRGRASSNLAAYEMIRSNPLFGVGLNNYDYLYNEYSKSLGLAVVSTERAAHNLYLEVAAESGLIGLLVFITILIISINTVLKARKKYLQVGNQDMADLVTGFLAALMVYLVAAFFVHAAYPRYFYLLIGMALALDFVVRQTDKRLLRDTPKNTRTLISLDK